MADPTIRTTSHHYPSEELDAMKSFYHQKTCVVGKRPFAQWAHMLDAALELSDIRLQWMLDRHLRQDRHPRHAAEVRENIVPLSPANQHGETDSHPPFSALFLHEDLVARTLAFEMELQRWRCAEVDAGRGDPGRPMYEDVFQVFGITEHRWHCAVGTPPLHRDETMYVLTDCPGIDPPSRNPFPILKTLLSIPFSLLHNIPRLSAMTPLSDYQVDLLGMGNKIIGLWSWDPPTPLTIPPPESSVRLQRTPAPPPIHDTSRNNITFESMLLAPYRTITPTPCPAELSIFELPSGGFLVGKQPAVSWEPELGLRLSAEDGEQPWMDTKDWEDYSIPASLEDNFSSISESTDRSSDGPDVEDLTPPRHTALAGASALTQVSFPLDLLPWLNAVTYVDQKMPSLTRGSFKRGVIRSMSVNDMLMIKGLIDPGVYVEFIDLESFSAHN